jgi:Icc-related predicted phosphoesterase
METYFLVLVNEDGTITTFAELPEEPLEAQRQASNYDVYRAAKEIVEDFEMGLLSDRVARTVLNSLMPPVQTPADAVKEKLKERGIKPESTPVAE